MTPAEATQEQLIAALEAVRGMAQAAPRFTVYGGASASGIVAADDILKAINEALEQP